MNASCQAWENGLALPANPWKPYPTPKDSGGDLPAVQAEAAGLLEEIMDSHAKPRRR